MANQLNRRCFLKSLSVGAGCLALSRPAAAAADEIKTETFTYKTVGDLEIKADVLRPDDDVVRPVLLWIHGGGLIVGNRRGFSRRVREPLLDAGYVCVSIDYRLAPETKAPAILEDVEDACRWIRERGRELFGGDASRLAVAGGSAGGYLTLSTGFRVEPRPAVLISFWGYGEIASSWYSRPSEFYRRTRPLVTKEQAYKYVSGPPVTDGSVKGEDRGAFYLYCRQNGIWPKMVAGFDPDTENEAFNPLCPLRNVTREYPPTLFIHGTNDTDVPYEQSALMAQALEKAGVEHKLITVPDAGHGIRDGDPEVVRNAYAAVVPFIDRYVKKS